jgi:uncharacterized protein
VDRVAVGVSWAGWHLPLFWIVEGFRGMGPLVVGWAVGLVAGSVVLAWLYREGNCSVLLVAAWHTAYNLTSATKATGPVVGTASSVLVICWAVWILRHERAPGGRGGREGPRILASWQPPLPATSSRSRSSRLSS